MHVRRFPTHVEVLAPAKINLFLEVLARRSDGFHEIETVLVPISVYDTLIVAPQVGQDIDLTFRWALGHLAQLDRAAAARELLPDDVPCGPENLAWRACALLRERSGIEQGAKMQLIKRIPAAAGLGGASSDAAATLIAGNVAWGLNWHTSRLLELAAELGSDVPFFLARGAAICRGRGERVEPFRSSRLPVVIVRPPVGLSTPRVYQQCQPKQNHISSRGLIDALRLGHTVSGAGQVVNDLQPAAKTLTPWIDKLEKQFQKQDVLGHQMSGSGSSYFGLCRSRRHARRVAARLKARSLGTIMTAATIVN